MAPRKQNGATRRSNGQSQAVARPPKRNIRYLPGYKEAEWAEYEKMKAHCRNLTPAAVRECAHLSAEYRRRFAMPEIDWKKIAAALQAKKIPFVLTGAYGIATWTSRPRSTHDVDILVKAGRNLQRAVKTVQGLYPDLEMRVLFVYAFFVPGERESIIDVTYPHRDDLAQTLETATVQNVDGVKVRIPRLEAALANKYGATLALNRDAGKRTQDLVDFYTMVKHSMDQNREPIDMAWLKELGELVWKEGGGEEIVRLVEQAKAGEMPNPNARPR
jgi:hypothetical protein